MIISEAQLRRVLEYLQTSPESKRGQALATPDVSPEFVDRVRSLLANMPETRVDRVEQARRHMDEVTSQDVADKMIARIISDSLR